MNDKSKIFNSLLDTFENEDIKTFAEQCIETIPNYFWEVGASSTGKWHPQYALGNLGLARHTCALIRFLNHIFEVECFKNNFTSRERDLMRVAGIMHDSMKSGTDEDYAKSKYTKFDHPVLAAKNIRNMEGLPNEEIEVIATTIESHMGQWCTDKRSSTVLPTPQNKYQRLVHLADYLASRKDIEVLFDKEFEVEIPNPGENRMISCKEYVEIRKKELKEEITKFKRKPKLLVIQVDNNPASTSYIKGKKKDCEEVGIEFEHIHIDSEKIGEDKMLAILEALSYSKSIDGIIIQLPIPDKYNLDNLLENIPAAKDVDGFRRDSCFKPCTPKGIMGWLEYNEVDLAGKDVVIIGRSDIVGKPLVNMMIEKGATVACCNSKTKNLKYYTRNADIVVSAIGKAKYLDSKYFRKGQIIVDVGINRDENGKLCGDVNGKYIYDSYVTPVPGSIGLTTRLSLLENVVAAYKAQS